MNDDTRDALDQLKYGFCLACEDANDLDIDEDYDAISATGDDEIIISALKSI